MDCVTAYYDPYEYSSRIEMDVGYGDVLVECHGGRGVTWRDRSELGLPTLAPFLVACRHGPLDDVLRLGQDPTNLVGITSETVRDGDNSVLNRACREGRLDVAGWLTKTFDLFPADDGSETRLLVSCLIGGSGPARWFLSLRAPSREVRELAASIAEGRDVGPETLSLLAEEAPS